MRFSNICGGFIFFVCGIPSVFELKCSLQNPCYAIQSVTASHRETKLTLPTRLHLTELLTAIYCWKSATKATKTWFNCKIHQSWCSTPQHLPLLPPTPQPPTVLHPQPPCAAKVFTFISHCGTYWSPSKQNQKQSSRTVSEKKRKNHKENS
jgi:hypothetical protein